MKKQKEDGNDGVNKRRSFPLKTIAFSLLAILFLSVITFAYTKGVAIPLPFFDVSAVKEIPAMEQKMDSVKTFVLNTTLVIHSDKVPTLNNQPMDLTLTVAGNVDRSNQTAPTSSGTFNLLINIEGTPFTINGDYALANQRVYYNMHHASSNFPINLQPIQNKWIYLTNDNNIASSLGNLFTQQNLYQNASYDGITYTNGNFTFHYTSNLTKADLKDVLSKHAQDYQGTALAQKVLEDISDIVEGTQQASIVYNIGVTDTLPYGINLTLVNQSGSSDTTFTINSSLSKFNQGQKVTIPNQASTLENAL